MLTMMNFFNNPEEQDAFILAQTGDSLFTINQTIKTLIVFKFNKRGKITEKVLCTRKQAVNFAPVPMSVVNTPDNPETIEYGGE